VAATASAILTDRGALAFEVGAGQAGEVAELLVDLGFMQVEGRQDLAQVPRVVLGRMSA
jgi:methylase of polypeptide subunit release factors